MGHLGKRPSIEELNKAFTRLKCIFKPTHTDWTSVLSKSKHVLHWWQSHKFRGSSKKKEINTVKMKHMPEQGRRQQLHKPHPVQVPFQRSALLSAH